MGKNFTILSLKKYHTPSQLVEQQLHNNRDIIMPHIDYNSTILNRNLINDGMDYMTVWKNRIRQAEAEYGHKIKVRSNAVIAFEVVLSYSNEQTSNIPIDKWCDENIKWLKDTFGEKNILAATLHMDEQTPHIHAEIIPIDDRGKLCAKTYIPGRKALFEMHNSYAENMSQFGLQRGKKHSKTKKKDLQNFYDSVNNVVNTPMPEQFKGESEEEYNKRLQKYIKDLRLAFLKQQGQIQELEENIETEVFHTFLDHKEAIDFQDELIESYGDVEFARERINDYRRLEKTVPKNTLSKLISELKGRFPIGENIRSLLPDRWERYKQNKKKKMSTANDEIVVK